MGKSTRKESQRGGAGRVELYPGPGYGHYHQQQQQQQQQQRHRDHGRKRHDRKSSRGRSTSSSSTSSGARTDKRMAKASRLLMKHDQTFQAFVSARQSQLEHEKLKQQGKVLADALQSSFQQSLKAAMQSSPMVPPELLQLPSPSMPPGMCQSMCTSTAPMATSSQSMWSGYQCGGMPQQGMGVQLQQGMPNGMSPVAWPTSSMPCSATPTHCATSMAPPSSVPMQNPTCPMASAVPSALPPSSVANANPTCPMAPAAASAMPTSSVPSANPTCPSATSTTTPSTLVPPPPATPAPPIVPAPPAAPAATPAAPLDELTDGQRRLLEAELGHKVALLSNKKADITKAIADSMKQRENTQKINDFINRHGGGRAIPRAKVDRGQLVFDVAKQL